MIGFTVVGKLAATAMTSSPGRIARSPSFGDVNDANATRLADEPEFTVSTCGTPTKLASCDSNCALKRPDVSHASIDASIMFITSGEPTTFPLAGIDVCPGTNALGPSTKVSLCVRANNLVAARKSTSNEATSTSPTTSRLAAGTVASRSIATAAIVSGSAGKPSAHFTMIASEETAFT